MSRNSGNAFWIAGLTLLARLIEGEEGRIAAEEREPREHERQQSSSRRDRKSANASSADKGAREARPATTRNTNFAGVVVYQPASTRRCDERDAALVVEHPLEHREPLFLAFKGVAQLELLELFREHTLRRQKGQREEERRHAGDQRDDVAECLGHQASILSMPLRTEEGGDLEPEDDQQNDVPDRRVHERVRPWPAAS